MSAPWPPPPDLASIQELVRAADPEGLLKLDLPPDEYDPEERSLLAAIGNFSTDQLVATNILPIIEAIWSKSFDLDDAGLSVSRPALIKLSQQIERFFGPEANPQTRQAQ